MAWLVVLIVFVLIVAAAVALLKPPHPQRASGSSLPALPRAGAPPERLPYRRRPYLLSKAEHSFYRVLLQTAVVERLQVLPKIRLSDLVAVERGAREWQTLWNRISQKHVDFVLCDRDSLRPLLVIELDDKSHEREDRQERDDFLDAALAAAELPLLRVKAGRGYVTHELEQQIAAKLPVQATQRATHG